MKNFAIILFALALSGSILACHIGRRHTTIIENSNNNYMKIEFAGDIYLNRDRTAISSISPGGYMKYSLNDKKMVAKRGEYGGVRYELYDNGQKLNLDENGRRFIAEALKNIISKSNEPRWK